MSQLKTALELASYGFKIIPVHAPIRGEHGVTCTCKRPTCMSIGKHPTIGNWAEVSSIDPEWITTWFRKWRFANVGVVTGKESNLVVLDIDAKSGGYETLDALQSKYGKLPDTATVLTGGGGMHFYFRHCGGIVKNSAGLIGQGIDIRGDGGFVVAPQSVHSSGGIYDWEASSTVEESGIARMPAWLVTATQDKGKKQANFDPDAPVIEGGRNNWLTSLAGALRRRGCGYKTIAWSLHYANNESCNPPLDNAEVKIIAKSIMRYLPSENTLTL